MTQKSGAVATVHGRILNRAIEIEMALDTFLKKYYMAKTLKMPKALDRTVKHLPFTSKIEILVNLQEHLTRGSIPPSLIRGLQSIAKSRDAVSRTIQKEFLGIPVTKGKLSKRMADAFDRHADSAMTHLLHLTRMVKKRELI
jgi:hypothetical protein